jgi:hypothetical protein
MEYWVGETKEGPDAFLAGRGPSDDMTGNQGEDP